MKLVRHIALEYRQGTSDKVYEIDLLEVEPDRFVVNFRYGRRGANLREGSKTVLPVPREQADRLFDRLVTEKTRKGYTEVSAPAAASGPPPAPPAAPAETLDLRAETVLRYLSNPGERPNDWPLSRIAWRAGELRIREAAPHIVPLLAHAEPKTVFSATWALGRLGGPEHLAVLKKRATEGSVVLRRTAEEGCRAVADAAGRADLDAGWRGRLPASLAGVVEDEAAFATAFQAWLATSTGDRVEVVHLLYLLDTPAVRSTLLAWLRDVPFAPPFFGAVRRLLKAAEFRDDGEVFGTIARRVSLTSHFYTGSPWGPIAYIDGRRVNTSEESARPDSKLAYSFGTRRWLRRHTWRVLRRLGEVESSAYTTMAAGLLLAWSDEDAGEPVRGWRGGVLADGYGRAWALNHVLFANSRRHLANRKGLSFRRLDNAAVGAPSPEVREEAFAALWDAAPDTLLRLLDDSRFAPVQDFAAKAFRSQTASWSSPTNAQLCAWMALPYTRTVELGADIALGRYDALSPDLALVAALCDVPLERVRTTAHGWVREAPDTFTADTPFIVRLALSPQADTRALIREVLASALVDASVQRSHVEGLFAALLELEAPEIDEDDEPVVEPALRELASLMVGSFPAVVRVLPLETVAELLTHDHPGVQEVGARLLLASGIPAEELPDAVIAGLLRSGFPGVRTIGLQLFGRLPDAVLLDRFAVLVHLVANPHADVRRAVRPIIARLAPVHASFAVSLFGSLVPILRAEEAYEGLHDDLLALVRRDLAVALEGVSADAIFGLLQSPSAKVAELGGELLARCKDGSGFTLRQLAELGSHEVLSVREAARAHYEADPARVRAGLDDALRVLDAKWEDTRLWAFQWFEATLTSADLTPERLVALCDGVRPDVQRFGRRMLGLHFESEHGPKVLEMLAQHPSPDMQLYATNYLERYASDAPERLQRLAPFFASVLARVNVGAVAKARVHAFLAAEAVRDEASARVVAEVLGRVSATCAVANRAAALQTLVRIHATWPDVPTVLTVRAPERRDHAV